jgi:UPF0755 protein
VAACAAFALFALMLAGVGWLLADRWLHASGPLREPAVVQLQRGSGMAAISAELARVGAIEWPELLTLLARLTGEDKGLKAGEYQIAPGMSPVEILALLRSGKVLLHPVPVPEGLTVQEVYALLARSNILAGELPPPPAEGSLLPETYLVPRGETRAAVVERMRAAMREALDELWARRPPNLPLRSPEEALALASIIEKETAVPAEYPLVSAVFHNRLRRGMKLQTDPTVIYGLSGGKGPLGRELTRADLEADHPYNTYRIDGLPPGPIANPGRAALAAALAPADVDYLYFVANGDGGHAFARTLAEHNRNVARWRELRRSAE